MQCDAAEFCVAARGANSSTDVSTTASSQAGSADGDEESNPLWTWRGAAEAICSCGRFNSADSSVCSECGRQLSARVQVVPPLPVQDPPLSAFPCSLAGPAPLDPVDLVGPACYLGSAVAMPMSEVHRPGTRSSSSQASRSRRSSNGPWMDLKQCYERDLVVLNVYDATQKRFVEVFNKAVHFLGAGAYHVGIEVHRQEWSYGRNSHGSGISAGSPRAHPSHRFRGAIRMGSTVCSKTDVVKLLAEMSKAWPGADYNILTRNCVHFAHAFVTKLGVGPVPSFLDRLARLGSAVASPLDLALHAVGSLTAACRGSGPLQCCLEVGEQRREASSFSNSRTVSAASWYSNGRCSTSGIAGSRCKVLPWRSPRGCPSHLSEASVVVRHVDNIPPAMVATSTRPKPVDDGDLQAESPNGLILAKCRKPQASEAAPEPPPQSPRTPLWRLEAPAYEL